MARVFLKMRVTHFICSKEWTFKSERFYLLWKICERIFQVAFHLKNAGSIRAFVEAHGDDIGDNGGIAELESVQHFGDKYLQIHSITKYKHTKQLFSMMFALYKGRGKVNFFVYLRLIKKKKVFCVDQTRLLESTTRTRVLKYFLPSWIVDKISFLFFMKKKSPNINIRTFLVLIAIFSTITNVRVNSLFTSIYITNTTSNHFHVWNFFTHN